MAVTCFDEAVILQNTLRIARDRVSEIICACAQQKIDLIYSDELRGYKASTVIDSANAQTYLRLPHSPVV